MRNTLGIFVTTMLLSTERCGEKYAVPQAPLEEVVSYDYDSDISNDSNSAAITVVYNPPHGACTYGGNGSGYAGLSLLFYVMASRKQRKKQLKDKKRVQKRATRRNKATRAREAASTGAGYTVTLDGQLGSTQVYSSASQYEREGLPPAEPCQEYGPVMQWLREPFSSDLDHSSSRGTVLAITAGVLAYAVLLSGAIWYTAISPEAYQQTQSSEALRP
jgi:heme exporter protein D